MLTGPSATSSSLCSWEKKLRPDSSRRMFPVRTVESAVVRACVIERHTRVHRFR